MKSRPRRTEPREKPRPLLVRAFVWVVLAIFILTSVGVALVNFTQ